MVTAADTTITKTYSIAVTRAASNNADLSTLTISNGTLTPAFASGTTSYTASVANSVTSLTVTPTVAEAGATVKVNGVTVASGSASSPIPLNVGSNTITVVVTAADTTTTKTYSIAVTRAAGNKVDLSNLTISNGTLTPAFASATTSYTASVANSVTSLTVTPTVADAGATVKVNGVTVASGSASGAIPLSVGERECSRHKRGRARPKAGRGAPLNTRPILRRAPFPTSHGTASVGRGGVWWGFTRRWGYFVTTTSATGPAPDSAPWPIGRITLGVKRTGKRSTGNPFAPSEVGGAGRRAYGKPTRARSWKRQTQPSGA